MKQIMATKPNYIFKVKLNQFFNLTRVVVSSGEQTGGVRTNSQHLFCALQGLACRCCGCRAPVCRGPPIQLQEGPQDCILLGPLEMRVALTLCVCKKAVHPLATRRCIMSTCPFFSIGVNKWAPGTNSDQPWCSARSLWDFLPAAGGKAWHMLGGRAKQRIAVVGGA